jgi:hypothetical protein
MILLYTGSNVANAPQINTEKSLGGYISSTSIPNARLSNLFSSISKSDVINKKAIIRMIALKNTTGLTVSDFKIYTNVENSHVKLKIAAVAAATDGDNNKIFESVLDSESLPYQATLDYHEGIDNAITVDTLANNDVIGIWLLREIDIETFPEFDDTLNLTPSQLVELLQSVQNNADENIQLIIDY